MNYKKKILLFNLFLLFLIITIPSVIADENISTEPSEIVGNSQNNITFYNEIQNNVISSNDSIQSSIDSSSEGSTIILEPGTYNQSGILVNKSLTFVGNGKSNLIILNGNNDNSSIFTITGGVNVNFINMTFINGNSSDGGAISSFDSPITISNCIFENNHASTNGGAVSLKNSSLQISDSQFYNNQADYDGGAVATSSSINCKISNTVFNNNSALGWGGTIYSWYTSMNLNNISISNGFAEIGGAIFNSGNIVATNSVFTKNKASSEGGCFYNYANSLIVNNCIILNNSGILGSDIYLYRTNSLSNFNNNWWGVNNPLNSTAYPINWTGRFVLDYDKTISYPATWLNLKTSLIENNSTGILTIFLESNNGIKINNMPLNVTVSVDGVNYYNNLINGTVTYNLSKTNINQTIITTCDYQVLVNTLNDLNNNNNSSNTTNTSNNTNTINNNSNNKNSSHNTSTFTNSANKFDTNNSNKNSNEVNMKVTGNEFGLLLLTLLSLIVCKFKK